jgi:Protein of unknown function (DUF3592)
VRKLVLVFIAASLIVTLWAVMEVWTEARSLGWSAVPAQVTQSDVARVAVYGSVSRSVQPTRTEWYEWRLRYTYHVDGMVFASDRLRFVVTPYWNKTSALEWAARYPVGAGVTAYVSPDDATFAVLEPGPSFASLFLLAAAILSGSGAAWILPGVTQGRVRRR